MNYEAIIRIEGTVLPREELHVMLAEVVRKLNTGAPAPLAFSLVAVRELESA